MSEATARSTASAATARSEDLRLRAVRAGDPATRVPASTRTPEPERDADPELGLTGLPVEAGLREVWARLGRSGAIRGLYQQVPGEWRARPEELRRLLAAVDARGRTGVTLGVCVQAASTVPLLQTGAAGSAAVSAALERVLSGTAVVALAATDAEAIGSDLAALGTEVRPDGDELVITGGKRWIANATGADYFLTLARQRPGRHFTSFGWVLVPAGVPGVQVEAADTPMFAGSGTGHVRFDGVRLPADHRVGRPGRALASFARHLSRERFAGALWAVALTARALEQTREILRHKQFDGEPLWDRPALRQRFAAALVEVHGLDALTRELEHRVLAGNDPAAAAMVKVAAAGVADRVLGICAGLQGADGYQPGGAQQLHCEAGVFGIGGGTVDLMLDTIADHAGDLIDRIAPAGRIEVR